MRHLLFSVLVGAMTFLSAAPAAAQVSPASGADAQQASGGATGDNRKSEVPKKLAVYRVEVAPDMQWTNIITAINQEMFPTDNSIRIASDDVTKKVMLYGNKDQVEKISNTINEIVVPADQLPVTVKVGDKAEFIKIPTEQVGRVASVCTNLGLPAQTYRLGDATYLRVDASHNETMRSLLNELLENR